MRARLSSRMLPHVHAVDADGAGGGVVQAGDQVGDGGLAGAAGPDQGRQLAGLDVQVHSIQGPEYPPVVLDVVAVGQQGRRMVVHAHVAQRHRAGYLFDGQVHRVRRIDDVGPDIQVAEDALEQGQRGLQFHRGAEQGADGEVQAGLQRGESDDGAGGDAGLPDAAEKDVAGQHVHDHGSQREEDLHTGPNHLAGHLAADLQVRQAHILVVEAGHLAVLGAEEAGEHDAGHRQGLLGDGGHLGGGLLDPGRGGAAALAHQVAEHREYRRDAGRDDGQFP